MRLITALILFALANPASAAVPDNNKLVIAFAPGSHALTPVANAQLDLAAGLYKAAHPYVMFSAGHTDATGGEVANLLLSVKRGQVVKQGLVARGVPAERLLIQAFGASDPVDAGDPAAGENRRAVVTWRVRP